MYDVLYRACDFEAIFVLMTEHDTSTLHVQGHDGDMI